MDPILLESVGANIKKISGSNHVPFGILFCFQDTQNFFEVGIITEGWYYIAEVVNGDFIFIQDWSYSPSLNEGYSKENKIEVFYNGDVFTIYFNDSYIISFNNSILISQGIVGGNFGYFAYVGDNTYEDFPRIPVDVRFKQIIPDGPTPEPTIEPGPTPMSNETKIRTLVGNTQQTYLVHISTGISYEGDTFVIGAANYYENSVESGALYIYKNDSSTWEETRLVASDATDRCNFGKSVSISNDGTIIAAGAPFDDTGAVYLYNWDSTSWNERKITPSDGEGGELFGYSVALSEDGNKLAVGAYYDDDNGYHSGSVYLYSWNGTVWIEEKVIASDGGHGDFYGFTVALSGDGTTLVVGAPCDDSTSYLSGSIYVYNCINWEEVKITASDAESYDEFGYTLDISNNGRRIVVGRYVDFSGGYPSDNIYIYSKNDTSWDEIIIEPSDGFPDDDFGNYVAISNDGMSVIVGSTSQDENGIYNGAAYLYENDGIEWTETKIMAYDYFPANHYGHRVDISGDGNILLINNHPYYSDGNVYTDTYIYDWAEVKANQRRTGSKRKNFNQKRNNTMRRPAIELQQS